MDRLSSKAFTVLHLHTKSPRSSNRYGIGGGIHEEEEIVEGFFASRHAFARVHLTGGDQEPYTQSQRRPAAQHDFSAWLS